MRKLLIAALSAMLYIGAYFNSNEFTTHYSYTNRENIKVNKLIKPYFDHIVEGLIKAGVKINLDQPISIQFEDAGNMPHGVIGIAKGMFDFQRVEIIINRSIWGSFNTVERYWVLIHEMGHDFWTVYHHGNGIMRPYHKDGESKKTLVSRTDEFIADLLKDPRNRAE